MNLDKRFSLRDPQPPRDSMRPVAWLILLTFLTLLVLTLKK